MEKKDLFEKAKPSKALAIMALLRHVVLIIPVMILMNLIWGLTGLIWSQLVADFLNAGIALIIYRRIDSSLDKTRT